MTGKKKQPELFKRRRFFHTFTYGIAQGLLFRLELCPARCCTGVKYFTVAGIQLLLSALSGTVFPVGYFLFSRCEKVNLVQSFPLTKIHDIMKKVFEKIPGYVMLVAGFCVAGPFCKSGLFHIEHTQTVENHVDVYISGMVGAIHVGADQDLMAGEILFSESKTQSLRFFSCQLIVDNVLWIETQNVMMGFDFFPFLILVKHIIEPCTFCIKKKGVTVDPVDPVLFSENAVPVCVAENLPVFFIMVI
jgi:hypothetical protein